MESGKGYYEVAYNTQTGTQLWKLPADSSISASVIDQDTVYVMTQKGIVYVLDAQHGKPHQIHKADGDLGLTTFNQHVLYLEVGDAHTQENLHRTADGHIPFTPKYVVALSEDGIEYERYMPPKYLLPNVLFVRGNILYMMGPGPTRDWTYHVLTWHLADAKLDWQQSIQTFPLLKPNVVLLAGQP